MTEDYKNKLLKYLTGNLDNESGTNEPQLIDKGTINQNVIDYLDNNFENDFNIVGELQQKDIDYILFYGFYYNEANRTTRNGFIYITKKDLQPVSLIIEYSSGTLFRPFLCLKLDEDGYVYGLDVGASRTARDYRFIMLNKIILSGANNDNFIVDLRQSYFVDNNITSQIFNLYYGKNLCTKKIGSADYFIFVDTQISSDFGIGVISLKINVGSPNEWAITKSVAAYTTNHMCFMNQYDNDGNLKIIIGGFAENYVYKELVYNYSDTPTITIKNSFPSLVSLHANGSVQNTIMVGYENVYIAYKWEFTQGEPSYNAIYKLDYDNESYEEIEVFTNTYALSGGSIGFYNIESELFFRYSWYTESGEDYIENTYIGLILNKELYYIQAQSFITNLTSTDSLLFITKVFNLYNLYFCMSGEESQKIQLVFNQNNYNGLPYEAPNCLIPNSSILYDSSDNIVFARNLYNKTISGQTTTSIVQIPNTLLNDTTIAKNDLWGQTNVVLIDDDTEIIKNIYETVNINFANTISIRNDNDPNNKILNPTAAIRLNSSTSNLGDYSDAKGLHIKVNYTDNTSSIINLDSSQVTFTSDTEATYSFDIYVNKAINNIQILSNDNATIYQTMDNLNLVVGKTYSITQDVEVI